MPINPDAVGATVRSGRGVLDVEGRAALRRRRRRRHERAGLHHREHQRRRAAGLPHVRRGRRLGSGERAVGQIGTFNPAMLVHGQQAVTLHQPIPVEGSATLTSKVVGIYDKGKAAVVATETEAVARRRRRRSTPTARRCSSGARAAGAATAGRPARPTCRPSGRPTTRSPTRPRPTRPSSTGSPATATRCTRTRRSRRWAASTGRSSTACAPTASPAGPCSTALAGSEPARFQHIEGRFSSPGAPGRRADRVDLEHGRRRGGLHDGDAGRHGRHRPGALPLQQLSA